MQARGAPQPDSEEKNFSGIFRNAPEWGMRAKGGFVLMMLTQVKMRLRPETCHGMCRVNATDPARSSQYNLGQRTHFARRRLGTELRLCLEV